MPATAVGRVTQAAIRRGVKAAVDHQRAYDLLLGVTLTGWSLGAPTSRTASPRDERSSIVSPFPGGYHVVAPRDVAMFLVRHLNDRSRREIIGLW